MYYFLGFNCRMQRYTIYPTSPNKLRRNIYKKDKYPKTQATDYLSLHYPTIALLSLLIRYFAYHITIG